LRKAFYVAFVLAIGAALLGARQAQAKAAFAGRTQMIDCSEVIAVVDVKQIDKISEKGFTWTYSQKATVVPIQVLKGKLSNPDTVYGGEDFICASCRLETGKALLFLNHSGKMLIGSNWHLSVRPVKDGMLDWFDGDSWSPLKPAKLSTVIAQIQDELGKDKDLKHISGSLQELSKANMLCSAEIGEAPGPQPVWLAYQKALKELPSTKEEDLWALFKNGTPAGRIYAAMLLYAKEPEVGKKALTMLGTSNATVDFRAGCMKECVGVWQVASDLYSKSKYLTLALSGAKP
jgi:hypothetical protein